MQSEAVRRELSEGFTPLGEFRVRNPDSYKLVKDLEKEYRRYLQDVRQFFFTDHNKSALPFYARYGKLKDMVEKSGLKMADVFPGIERAYEASKRVHDDGFEILQRDLEVRQNKQLNHEFTLATSPVPKEALQKMESIWERGSVPNIGEDFRMLSGIQPNIPRLYEHQVGETIVKQLGGFGRLKAMIGARNFVWTKDGVTFVWPSKQRSRGNGIEIKLRPDDTYDVTFYDVRNKARKEVKTYSNVYADALRKVFTDQTGLHLSL